MDYNELNFVLDTYGEFIKNYLGTNDIAISLFANSQEFFDDTKPEDTSINYRIGLSPKNSFNVTTYHDFSVGQKNLLTDVNLCKLKHFKVINIVTPFTRDKMYDFIIARSDEMEQILKELEERRAHSGEKEINFPVIGINFESIEKEIINFLLNEEFREFCKERNIPLKRGIIFEGPPGNGKTLTLKYLRHKASKNNISFNIISSPKEFIERHEEYFDDGKNIFVFEDFDNVVQDREEEAPNQILGKLLNTLEGIKEVSDTVSIFTTNKIGMFDSAFIRPGRIDKVIRFNGPDEDQKREFLWTYLAPSLKFMPFENDLAFTTDFILSKIKDIVLETGVSYAILKGICDDIHIFTFNKGNLTEKDITDIIKEKVKGANRNSEAKTSKDYVL